MRPHSIGHSRRLATIIAAALLGAAPLVGCETDDLFGDTGSGYQASSANQPVEPPSPESGFGGASSVPTGSSSSASRSVRADVSDRYVYVIRMTPGPNWRSGLATADQPGYDRHLDTLRRWSAQGIVVLGGPTINDQGSYVIIRAGSLQDAQDLAATDGAVIDGLFRADVSQLAAQFPGRN